MDAEFIRAALALARQAMHDGEPPFGAVMVGPRGDVMAESVDRDAVHHATRGAQRELRIPAATLNSDSGEPLDLSGGILSEECLELFRRYYGTA